MKKISLKNYFSPTPKRLRILGDAMASASVFISSYAILNEHQKFGVFVLVSGWVGKFITNFFTEEKTTENEPK
jgi:hypothetical protein